MNREEKLVKNTAILTIGTVFSSVFSFVLVPIFSKWLSTSDYGTYDVYLTYITLLLPFITLACGEAAFRFLLDCKSDAERKKVLNGVCLISSIGTLIGIVVIIAVFSLAKLQQMGPFILLFVSFMLYNQGNFIARGLRKLASYTISNILYLIFMAIFVTFFVFFRNMGLAGILLGNAIGHFAGFVYLAVSCRMWKYVSFDRPDKDELKRIIRYSAPLMPNSISWWITNVSDRSIINVILGASFNGIYAISYKLPSLCSTVFGVFHMSWLESAVDTVDDEDRNQYTNGVFNQIMPFCFCAAACVLAVNRYFYKWIWDAKYASGSVYVWILLAGMCFSFLAQFLGGILIAEKRTKANGFTTVIAAAINIVVHIALIWSVGLYAASISTFVSYFGLFIIRMILLKKNYRLTIGVKSILAAALFVLISVFEYFDNEIVGVLLVLVAAVVSLVLNWDMVRGIAMKFIGRKSK